jgi:hypothetical protein
MLNQKYSRVLWLVAIPLLFVLYSLELSQNPPGFYVDESAEAYNAVMIARTGAGEFGDRFPLFFQTYTNGFTQYVNPVQIYVLSVIFRFLPPSILLARVFSALGVFSACLLLGLLAKQVSGKLSIGILVAVTALLTPWFFVARGLLLEPQFVPLALAPFLLAVYAASTKESWNWRNILAIAGSLALLTYCYTSGRVLSALLAFGLISFATTKQRLLDVVKTWVVYGVTLIPILVFNSRHPGLLTKRLNEISYIKPGVALSDISSEFVRRYLEDQSLYALLLTGDYHARHHVQGSGGPILFGTFLLAIAGLLIVIGRRMREPWWRFIVYGLAISIVPGAISIEPFHQLRLMAYPVFLLLLMVPALEWLLADKPEMMNRVARERSHHAFSWPDFSRRTRVVILAFLLALTTAQAVYFQTIFRREGPKREFDFDVPYKGAYDAAVVQPSRPIYLEDGFWGPAYIHALWYATVEGRPTTEFVHLEPGAKAPSGGIVISSDQNCLNCEILKRSGVYLLYKSN